MSVETASHRLTGDLRTPLTGPGRALLDLVDGHLPQLRAAAEANDRDGTFPAEIFEGLRKNGVLGATVPAELGGLGVGCLHDVALALRLVAEGDAAASLALHMQFSRALTLTYDWQHGSGPTRSLAERLLRGMGSGEAVVCTTVKDAIGHQIVSTLTPCSDGTWLLQGRKMLASMAPIATVFVISARIKVPGSAPEQAAVVIARDDPGLTVLDNWDGLGMRASGSVDLVMDGCVVQEQNIFFRGPVARASDPVLAGQTISSIAMLGIYLGIVGRAREIAVDTVRGRGKDQAAVRTLVAEIDARIQALEATVGLALSLADAPAAGELADPAERGRRLMTAFQRAKLIVNRVAPDIVGDCLTLVGGASYTAQHPLSRLYRDVRAGSFMHPFTYADAVDYLSAQALDH